MRRRIKLFLAGRLGKLLITAVVRSSRVSCSGQEAVADLQARSVPLLYYFWHRHIFYVIHHFRNCGARPLISLSEDGELVSRVARAVGMRPVRGSSSSGGARAFLELADTLKQEKTPVLITADGPKGPARQIKEGTVLLAAKCGAALIPISWYSSRVRVLEKSWDRFLVPLPFGRIHFLYGRPLETGNPPAQLKKLSVAEWQQELKKQLDELEAEAMRRCRPQPSVGGEPR